MRILLAALAGIVLLSLALGSVRTDDPFPVVASSEPEPAAVPPSVTEPEDGEDAGDEDEWESPAPRSRRDPFGEVVRRPAHPGYPALTVDLVCAETGRNLTGGRMLLKGHGALPFEKGAFRLGAAPCRAPEYEWLKLEADPPPGHVVERPGFEYVECDVTRWTKELRIRLVAWPEADVRVVVTEPDGSAAVGATVDRFFFRQCLRTFPARLTDRQGAARVPGVPAIPGQPVQVLARKGDREAASPKVRVGRSKEEVWAAVELPPEPRRADLYRGPAGCVPVCRRDPFYPEPVGNANLRIEVRRVDGRPAHGATIVAWGWRDGKKVWRTAGRLDENGVILFAGLPPGRATVRVREDGFLMAKEAAVDVHAGTVTDFVVREDPGLPLDIRVVDVRGRPIAGAGLEIWSRNAGDYLRLEGDVQHIGFHTGADGRYLAPRLPEGRVRVKARVGSREVTEWTEAGGTLELSIGKKPQ